MQHDATIRVRKGGVISPEIGSALASSGTVQRHLEIRTHMSEDQAMKSADFLRRLNRLATKRGWPLEVAEGASHTKVRLNGRRSTVPRHATDLKTGTLRGILKQLGLADTDLEV
jgi:mRNA interferase HicA